MNKRRILHIILWMAAIVCFGMTIWDYYEWVEQGANPDDSLRFHWMVWCVVGVICIAVWFFTREKEEEISITRAN